MKRRIIPAATLLLAMTVLTGCPAPVEPEPENPVTPEITSVSVEEGSVQEVSVSTVTIVWSVPVTVSNASGITLNGAAVTATVQNKNMSIALGTLDYSSSYTLKLAAGAVVNKNDDAPAKEFTLNFSTEEAVTPNPDISEAPDFSKISDSPVNPDATSQTKNLYSYLKSIFGTKTLSGTMADVAYKNTMAEWVHEQTGKWSALTCYDFIFYTHRGDKYASSYTWVDYDGIVNNARQWWADGGIVALMWHWHDPSRNVQNFYCKSDKDGYASFDLSAALADTSSASYKYIISDIDTISRHIGELQKAGVPVIFRPLHEAEGSYRWGAWFWWGNAKRDRAASCRALYRLMYDRMVNHNGLNNIIWVWTVSFDDYDYLWYADAESWYPGDDVVDIVGIDIYDNSGTRHGSHTDLFRKTAAIGRGKKMVTLAETGFIPSAEDMHKNGDTWLWYMPWYGNYTQSPDYNADYWKTSFESDDIITRDELPSLK